MYEDDEQPMPSSYTPAVVTEVGTVTGATLGNKGGNQADDTQYWNN
jgi:hypothetical protein